MKSFVSRAFVVRCDDGGRISGYPTSTPDRPFFDRLTIAVRRDDEAVPGEFGAPLVDDDEIEQRWSAPGLALEVRHSFVGGWRTRIALSNLAATTWVGSVRLAVRPGAGHRVWRLATGTGATLALLPEQPEIPILYVRVTTSPAVLRTVTDDPAALELGPYRLGAGERLVSAFEWATAPSPRALGAVAAGVSIGPGGSGSVSSVPRWLCAAVGEEIWLPADPDAALVAPGDVDATQLDDRWALTAHEPGRYRVELRSAQGSTVLDLGWVPPTADFLAGAAERVLSAPAGPAGVVPMPDVASALVVQRAARTPAFPAAAAAADALDQFTARLDDAGPDPALRAIYLAGEYDRLGDPELVARAAAVLDGVPAATPGLGLALMRTAVAAVVAGSPPPAPRPVPIAVPIREPTPDATPDPLASVSSAPEGAADLELLLASRAANRTDQAAVTRSLYRLGLDLHAGLPGRLPPDRGTDELARACAVLRLVPDQLSGWWRSRFGVPVGELADARALELVERLGASAQLSSAPLSRAYAWLALSC